MYIDIGARDREDAEKAVKIGDYVSFDSEVSTTGDLVKGRRSITGRGVRLFWKYCKKNIPFLLQLCLQSGGSWNKRSKGGSSQSESRIALVLETTGAMDIPG